MRRIGTGDSGEGDADVLGQGHPLPGRAAVVGDEHHARGRVIQALGSAGRGRGMPNATQCATVGQLRPCIDVPAGNDETVKCWPPSTVEMSLTRSALSGPHGPAVRSQAAPGTIVADVQLRLMIWSGPARSGVTVHEWPPLVVER